jgi:hypothetical protein
MKVYHRNENGIGKWIVAALAFLVVMSITFADVYGITVPNKPGDGKGKDPKPNHGKKFDQTDQDGRGFKPDPGPNPNPTPTPEPGTLVLMGIGLGAAAVARKFKQAK